MAISILVVEPVSIHTPIQGVTECDGHRYGCAGVSIHTPIQGVTLITVYQWVLGIVSIHTPIQGVTPRRITVKREE